MRVTRDENFDQRLGRAETQTERDPYASQVKTYLIDRQTTGSSEFDLLFDTLSPVAQNALVYDPARDEGKIDLAFSTLAVKMRGIQRFWEDNHSGERFSSLQSSPPLFTETGQRDTGSEALWRELDNLTKNNGDEAF